MLLDALTKWLQNKQEADPLTGSSGTSSTKNMSLGDLTKWLQNTNVAGYQEADPSWQKNLKSAYDAQADAFNQYQTNVQGLQGLLGGLTNQTSQLAQNTQDTFNQAQGYVNQAAQSYDPNQWTNYLQSGQVAQPIQEKMQNIRDLQMENYMTDLNKQYGRALQDMMNRRAFAGVSGSNVTADLANRLFETAARQARQAANTYDAEMAQNLLAEPYRQHQAQLAGMNAQLGLGQGLGSLANLLGQSMLQNYNTQAQYGVTIPQYTAPMFDMSQKLATIPTMMREAYATPLLQMWDALLKAKTQKEVGHIYNESSDDDYSWIGGVGALLGGLGGLF